MHEYALAERKTRLEITGAIPLYILPHVVNEILRGIIPGQLTDCPAGVCVCVCVRTYPPL